ncbi:MAG: hypothetical protein WCJ33_00765 [Pseudomonadota bacterium]
MSIEKRQVVRVYLPNGKNVRGEVVEVGTYPLEYIVSFREKILKKVLFCATPDMSDRYWSVKCKENGYKSLYYFVVPTK